ncbi:hypothetical protein Sliba_27670 [Streptomyces nigrescens]|uniref:Uncharacterized protein n=1 Tax=Streptomyces nigrescens TaxID=1920 RepID=A0A640TGJ9_STRNI|nr:hypothetical protein Sliba_27670 [Streptomyces libani subsp. libani]GGV90593.1 hypothetical protein GCM10010500_18490 [Streptomyces libani subsp. libani]
MSLAAGIRRCGPAGGSGAGRRGGARWTAEDSAPAEGAGPRPGTAAAAGREGARRAPAGAGPRGAACTAAVAEAGTDANPEARIAERKASSGSGVTASAGRGSRASWPAGGRPDRGGLCWGVRASCCSTRQR